MFSIFDTISTSLRLAWKHKYLWVLVLLMGGMGFNGGGGGTGEGDYNYKDDYPYENQRQINEYDDEFDYFDDFDNFEPSINTTNSNNLETSKDSPFAQVEGIKDNISDVLGLSDSQSLATADNNLMLDEYYTDMDESYMSKDTYGSNSGVSQTFMDDILDLFLSNILTVILVSLSVLALVIFAIFIAMLTSSWATGSMMNGMNDAINNREYTLRDLGTYGRLYVREIIKFRIVYSLIVLLIFVAVFIIVFVSLMLFPLLLILFVPLTFIVILNVFVTSIFAVRFISLKQKKYMDAIKSGFRMYRANVLKVILMLISNCLVIVALLMIVAGGIFGVIMGLFGGGDLIQGLQGAVGFIIYAIIGIPLFILVTGGLMAFMAYIRTYHEFTWTLFFNHAADRQGYSLKKELMITEYKDADKDSNNEGSISKTQSLEGGQDE